MAFTTAINTSLLTTYLIKKFIPTLEAELQFQKFTTKAIIPEGQGKIGRFNVFSNPPGTSTALAEGSTSGNEITTLTTTGTDCTIAEYGEFIKVPKLQKMAAVKGTMDQLAQRMAFGGALALDTLVRTQAATTTTAFYASTTDQLGGSTTAAIPGRGSAAAIMGATELIRNATVDGVRVGGQGFTGVKGHTDGNFAAIVSPRCETQITTEGTTGRITWKDAVVNVPGADGQGRWVKGYVGSIYGTSVYRTQNYSQTTVTSLSDNNYVLAEGGLGAVAFEDMDAKIVINDVNSPYKNVDSIAWYAMFGTSKIANERVVRLYTNAV